jgi:hypothetical protein
MVQYTVLWCMSETLLPTPFVLPSFERLSPADLLDPTLSISGAPGTELLGIPVSEFGALWLNAMEPSRPGLRTLLIAADPSSIALFQRPASR